MKLEVYFLKQYKTIEFFNIEIKKYFEINQENYDNNKLAFTKNGRFKNENIIYRKALNNEDELEEFLAYWQFELSLLIPYFCDLEKGEHILSLEELKEWKIIDEKYRANRLLLNRYACISPVYNKDIIIDKPITLKVLDPNYYVKYVCDLVEINSYNPDTYMWEYETNCLQTRNDLDILEKKRQDFREISPNNFHPLVFMDDIKINEPEDFTNLPEALRFYAFYEDKETPLTIEELEEANILIRSYFYDFIVENKKFLPRCYKSHFQNRMYKLYPDIVEHEKYNKTGFSFFGWVCLHI